MQLLGIIPARPPLHWEPDQEYGRHRVEMDCRCYCRPDIAIGEDGLVEVFHNVTTPLLHQSTPLPPFSGKT